MGTLLFRCPRTASVIDSNVETDDDSIRSSRDLAIRIYCPHCREDHELPISQGIIDGQIE
jgi:hypothetical protein